jgi:hypothetical protein
MEGTHHTAVRNTITLQFCVKNDKVFGHRCADKKEWREWLQKLEEPVQCDMSDRSPLVSLTVDGSMMAALLDASW